MSGSPRVTVGVPVYNGEKLLAAALDSLLAQTYRNFKVIISDNASTDGTREIGESYARKDERVIYTRNEKNIGAAGNLNRLVALADTPYFKWAAHDDLIAPTFLEKCVALMDSSPPTVGLVITRRMHIDMQGRPVPETAAAPSYDRISFSRLLKISPGHFPIFTWGLHRLENLRKAAPLGSFVWSDLAHTAELRLLGEFREVPEVLYFQRLHPPKQRRSPRAELQYLGARNGQVLLPGLNLFQKHLAMIYHARVPWKTRVKLLGAMGGYVQSRVVRALRHGTLNRNIWDEARFAAEAFQMLVLGRFNQRNHRGS